MGYGFIGTFVNIKNKQVIATVNLDRLKSLNMTRYDCDFEDISPSGTAKDEDYPDITSYAYYEYVSYYKKEIFDKFPNVEFKQYRKKEWNKTANAYYVEEAVYNEKKDEFEAYAVRPSMEELLHCFNENDESIIILYKKEIRKNRGMWFKYSDFANAEEKIKKEYFDKRDELRDLKKLRNTKEWFEMSEDGKNSYLSEVNYLEEDIEEYEWKYNAIEYIIAIFDLFKEDTAVVTKNEFEELDYQWSYDDKREIELYIEVV